MNLARGRKHAFVWSNRLLLANLLLLLVIKASVSYSALPLAEIAQLVAFDRSEIIQRTNALRSLYGYSLLKENKILDRAASQRLDDMVKGNYFSHISPSGVLPWHWLDINGYQYTYAGENLAVGFFDAQAVVEAWKQSPIHRDNLLNKNYREIGVAVAPAQIKDYSGFLVVQLLATSLSKGSVAGISVESSPLLGSYEPAPFAQIQPETSEIGGSPVIVEVVAGRSSLYNFSRIFSRTFSFYTLTISLIAMILLFFYDRERKKELAWRAAMHLFIFAVSFGVPLLSHVSEGVIF